MSCDEPPRKRPRREKIAGPSSPKIDEERGESVFFDDVCSEMEDDESDESDEEEQDDGPGDVVFHAATAVLKCGHLRYELALDALLDTGREV